MTADPRWRPNATVATVVVRDNEFLMVEERDRDTGDLVLNQPAGHLEPHESLIEAAQREVLEETRWQVEISAYLGVARYPAVNGVTYLRHSFLALPVSEIRSRPLDDGIIAAHWMTRDQLARQAHRLRSPLVLAVIDLYLRGDIAPLSLVIDTDR